MFREQAKVREFHEKHRFPVGVAPGENHETDLVRVHLINEELAELALGIARKDKVLIADALGDLAYVVLGAAVVYGIPLQEVFDEIHRSNMTKAVRVDGDTRLRDKGDSYVSADIGRALGFPAPGSFPKVVCLCGSTRFGCAFTKANRDETMAGNIVLSVGMLGRDPSDSGKGKTNNEPVTEFQKLMLDALHKRKIDIADEVFVLNVGGYIGESTRSEIQYAVIKGIPVRYLEPAEGGVQ